MLDVFLLAVSASCIFLIFTPLRSIVTYLDPGNFVDCPDSLYSSHFPLLSIDIFYEGVTGLCEVLHGSILDVLSSAVSMSFIFSILVPLRINITTLDPDIFME